MEILEHAIFVSTIVTSPINLQHTPQYIHNSKQ